MLNATQLIGFGRAGGAASLRAVYDNTHTYSYNSGMFYDSSNNAVIWAPDSGARYAGTINAAGTIAAAKVTTDTYISACALASDGYLYAVSIVSGSLCDVYKINPSTWAITASQRIQVSPALGAGSVAHLKVVGGYVFIALQDSLVNYMSMVLKLSASTLAPSWGYYYMSGGMSGGAVNGMSPTTDGGVVVGCTTNDGVTTYSHIYKLNSSGTRQWTRSTSSTGTFSTGLATDASDYIYTGYGGGNIAKLAADGSASSWTRAWSNAYGTKMKIAGSHLYLSTTSRIAVLNLDSLSIERGLYLVGLDEVRSDVLADGRLFVSGAAFSSGKRQPFGLVVGGQVTSRIFKWDSEAVTVTLTPYTPTEATPATLATIGSTEPSSKGAATVTGIAGVVTVTFSDSAINSTAVKL